MDGIARGGAAARFRPTRVRAAAAGSRLARRAFFPPRTSSSGTGPLRSGTRAFAFPRARAGERLRRCVILGASMRRVLPPRLVLVSLGHFTIDSYSSFFSPLLPLLVSKLHLNLTLVGSLVALAAVSSSFAQPLFGWLSDRVQRPWFVAFGPLVAAVFLSSVGRAPSYGTLIALLMLGGIGVAAFHPQAAVLAGDLSPRRGLAMSFFVTGGTLGFSLGPLFAVSVVGAVGLERTWVAAL